MPSSGVIGVVTANAPRTPGPPWGAESIGPHPRLNSPTLRLSVLVGDREIERAVQFPAPPYPIEAGSVPRANSRLLPTATAWRTASTAGKLLYGVSSQFSVKEARSSVVGLRQEPHAPF